MMKNLAWSLVTSIFLSGVLVGPGMAAPESWKVQFTVADADALEQPLFDGPSVPQNGCLSVPFEDESGHEKFITGCMTVAGAAWAVDSPLPGPGDAVSVVALVLAGGVAGTYAVINTDWSQVQQHAAAVTAWATAVSQEIGSWSESIPPLVDQELGKASIEFLPIAAALLASLHGNSGYASEPIVLTSGEAILIENQGTMTEVMVGTVLGDAVTLLLSSGNENKKGRLILTRKLGESVIYTLATGETIKLTVVGIYGRQVRLLSEAGRDVTINREEIQEQIDAEKTKAFGRKPRFLDRFRRWSQSGNEK